MNCDHCKEPITDACFILNERGERIHIRCLTAFHSKDGQTPVTLFRRPSTTAPNWSVDPVDFKMTTTK